MAITKEQEPTVESLTAQVAELQAALAKLQHENQRLSDELAVALNRFFARKSERIDPAQLRLFAEELGVLQSQAEAAADPAPASKSKPKGHGRAPFPAHLPRERIDLDLPESERRCTDCGAAMAILGDEVTERGHMVPAKVIVRRYVRRKYACPRGHAVKTAELPASVIDKGKYEASVYAHLAVAKYGDHLPLTRLEGIYKRHGFAIAKSSMWEMLRRTSEVAAEPILAQMRKELLDEPILEADETPVTVRLEDRKGTKQGYVWTYGTGRRRVFDFTMSRGRDGPRRFLEKWSGTLLTDGYSGYDEVVRQNGITRAGCWAHARRGVKEALERKAPGALPLLRSIGRLFWIERAVKRRGDRLQLDHDAVRSLRARVRRQRSTRALIRIRKLVDAGLENPTILPKSLLGKALGYVANQWEPLTRFVEDPGLAIHNNDSERALRHVVVGRKNWLFFASPRGGEVGATLFSLIATCKALGVHPEAYLEDVLHRVDTTPASEIARLTPWAWAAERATETA